MPGFIAKTGSPFSLGVFREIGVPINGRINDGLYEYGFSVERLTVNKFMKDKPLFSHDELLVLIEGVILNSATLMKKYKQNTFEKCVEDMYRRNGETFFSEFRGSFCGIVYDKKADVKLIFTDHIGSKQVFYSVISDEYIFSSDLLFMAEYIKAFKVPRKLDTKAAYYLLTLGYMFEDATLFEEVKRLLPGHYLKLQNNICEINRYYKLPFNYSCKLTESEIIDELENRFTAAVKHSFEKDLEYGYKHLVNLSGGLDSRMTTFVANKIGYGQSIVNNTISQTDQWDEKVPKKIASDLNHQWLFSALDNGSYLMRLDDAMKLTCGMSLLSGCSHIADFYDKLNMNEFGLVHTGQLGDAIVGSILKSVPKTTQKYLLQPIAESLFYPINEKVDIRPRLDYDNEEDFRFFTRAFLGANQGLLAAQRYTETISPFYDIEFMEFCFSIPLEFRLGHKLYIKWINTKHKDAMGYKWAKHGAKPNAKMISAFGYTAPLVKVPHLLFEKAFMHKVISAKGMNPFDYWYINNESLRAAFDRYFSENYSCILPYPELADDCKKMYELGNTAEKTQVLTLLGMYRTYFFEIV